jgi:hypothetical protein
MLTLNQTAPAAKAASQDAGHYYLHSAGTWSPLYTPEKNYTLREARKDKAAGKQVVPSVTTIQKVLHKQMLLNWKMEQVAKACFSAGKEGAIWSSMEDYVDAMVARADGASAGAADLGTKIHAADEANFFGHDYDAAMKPYVDAISIARIQAGVRTIGRETACGSLEHGYGGKCDEHGQGMTICDIKSRKSKGKKVASYETDAFQLAAYGYALFGADFFTGGRGIIFAVSTTDVGLVTTHTFTGPELRPAFDAFLALCAVWRYTSKFDSRCA